jgi:hypothetical protein
VNFPLGTVTGSGVGLGGSGDSIGAFLQASQSGILGFLALEVYAFPHFVQ